MTWRDGPIVCLDTETTGPDPTTARLVTYALVALDPDGNPYPHMPPITGLVNPGIPIPEEATAVHGITTHQAESDGMPPAAALTDIATALLAAAIMEWPIVVYNAPFDLTLLAHEIDRHTAAQDYRNPDGHALEPDNAALMHDVLARLLVIDPLVMDKQLVKRRKGAGSRRLGAVAAAWGVEITDWHTAEADALAAGRIAQAMSSPTSALRGTPLADLMQQQGQWHDEQQAELRAYYARRGDTPALARMAKAWPYWRGAP